MVKKKPPKTQKIKPVKTDAPIITIGIKLVGKPNFAHKGRSRYGKRLVHGYQFTSADYAILNHPVDIDYFINAKKDFMEIIENPVRSLPHRLYLISDEEMTAAKAAILKEEKLIQSNLKKERAAILAVE